MLNTIFQTKAPAMWSWEWWTEGAIPAVAALGTLIVAVAALWISINTSRRDRTEREHARRAAFAESVFGLLDGLNNAPRDEIFTAWRGIVGPVNAVRDDAAGGPGGAPDTAEWVARQSFSMMKRIHDGKASEQYTVAWVVAGTTVFTREMRRRIRGWVRTGHLDDRPIFEDDSISGRRWALTDDNR